MFPMMTTPLLIGGVVNSAHLSTEQAGWIGTISIATVAIMSMATSAMLHRRQGKFLYYFFRVTARVWQCGFRSCR
jgi:hypothetical protein